MSREGRRFWHGGAPGRRPGELLTSPQARGLSLGPTHRASIEQGQTRIAQCFERVYVTASRDLAWVFASNWLGPNGQRGGGCPYLVETDSYKPDEDMLSLRGESFQCTDATVILNAGVVKFDAKRVERIITDTLTRLERAKGLATRAPKCT